VSFYTDRKKEHEEKADKALKENDYAKAFVHFIKAAEFGLQLAEQMEGLIAQRYLEDALLLIETAEAIKKKVPAEAEKAAKGAKKASKEKKDEDEPPEGGFALSEKPTARLDDVAGLDEVKRVLKEDVLLPFQHPEVYEKFKVDAGAGVLMYGPPGNGKTFVARAIAGEVDAAFFPISCGDIKDKYVGETEKNLKRLFAEAEEHERSVLFFDEVESLLGRRGKQKVSAVTQFLALTDGVVKADNCMLILAATNKPWQLDEAVIRPGRIGTHVYVGLPDAVARAAIAEYSLRDVPLAEEISFEEISEKTKGFSGADISSLCKQAKKPALLRQIAANESESEKDEVVTNTDIDAAIARVAPSCTPALLKEFATWREERGAPVASDG
jgi:SpoVK/Ycf46/Vps4 family AAA+-type ATPase